MKKIVHGTDKNHPSIATTYHAIGNVYNSQGEYTLALEYYNNSLEMNTAVYGAHSKHPRIAITIRRIANIHQRNKPSYRHCSIS